MSTTQAPPAKPPENLDPRQLPYGSNPRLSIPFHFRLPLVTTVAAFAGLSLGIAHGSQIEGFRFRAENAHRLPTTATGWYLYHKSKNYHMMFGAIKSGLKMAGKLGFWVCSFATIEEAVDRLRGTRDFASTVVAGLSLAGGFSLWSRFPLPTATRTAKSGLLFGLGFGLGQDALALARGQRLAYVEFLLGRGRPSLRDETPST